MAKAFYNTRLIFTWIILSVLSMTQAYADAPQKFSYQAVIRDADGELVTNGSIGMQVSILKGSADGSAVYVETHQPATNDNGLVSLKIGEGTVISGSKEEINWAEGPYFIHTETDLQGGSNYTLAHTSELLSVPYALHATTAETLSEEIVETDPVFMDSPAAGILLEDIDHWDMAFDWGDHSLADYLTEETDPLFQTSPAAAIVADDISNWDEAFSWGDHDGLYHSIDWNPAWDDIEDKPDFADLADVAISGSYNDLIDTPELNIGNWDEAYSWGDHSLADYLTEELDPLFTASPAAGIEDSDIDSWDAAFSWGDHGGLYHSIDWNPAWDDIEDKPDFAAVAISGSYEDLADKPQGTHPGEMNYWDGNEWLAVVPGQYGQTLSFCGGVPTWGPCPPSAPIVNTTGASNITDISASSGGVIIDEGSSFISVRGIVWDTNEYPTLEVNLEKLNLGDGTGSFTGNMTGLTPETEYFVRAFATNEQGTAYGNQVMFTTDVATAYPPTVITASVSEVTQTSAISGGDVTDDGGAPVTAKGVVWNTSSLPTISNNAGITNEGSGSGSFVSELEALTFNTKYYLRAYAVNSHGVTYGGHEVFITLADPALPTLITAEVSDITPTSAISGGDITDAGEGEIILRGVCYSTTENPTIYDFITQDGEGAGSFISELTNLESAKTYYVRAFASSTAGGIGYGNQLSFTTLDGPPSLKITATNNSQPAYTSMEAMVTHDGGQAATEGGFVWDLNENPTLENNMGSIEATLDANSFTSDLTGLTPNTTFYVRAYATNSDATGYSDQVAINFWDYHATVTDMDGNVYNTIMIGEQEWMAENLKTTKYSNGLPINYPGEDNYAWNNNTDGAYAWIDNYISWKHIYGALYNWYAVDNENGLCPAGWRVPSDEDWTQLVDYVSSLGFPNSNVTGGAGNALKSCRQAGSNLGGCDTSEHPRWDSHNTHQGFNEFGFSALPGGTRDDNGYFSPFYGQYGLWWTSSEISWSTEDAFDWSMFNSHGHVGQTHDNKASGLSVRCIKNIE